MAALGLLLVLSGGFSVQAQEHRTPSPAPHAHPGLKADHYDANTFVPPVAGAGKRSAVATAQINVTYQGFSAEARAAFAFAISLWEGYVVSPVAINVEAIWTELEVDVLGSAGPAQIFAFDPRDLPDRAVLDTWYPSAMGEALAGRDLSEDVPDVVASFNSAFENWYFGTDGQTPPGQFDFVSVVLHELGHGLGFLGSFTVQDGDDSNGDECLEAPVGQGCWGFGSQEFPIIFDRFTEDRDEVPLLDTRIYPNPSEVLGDLLQSGTVFFDGASARLGNEDVPVDLYAPANFEPASSFSHLDERRFPPGNPNSLMTPRLARAEAIHTPGPITCGMFEDMGWRLGPDCESLLFSGLAAFEAAVEGNDVLVAWRSTGEVDVTRFEVEQLYYDGPYEEVAEVPGDGPVVEDYSVLVEDLAPGQYAFRIRQVLADGSVLVSGAVEVFVPPTGDYYLSEAYPNPFTSRARIELIVNARQEVTVALYDLLGQRVAEVFDGVVGEDQRLSIAIDADALPSGLYIVRVEGASFRATRTAVLVR